MTIEEQLLGLGSIALAMVLGSLIGFERAWGGKAAGVRTHALVAGAAALIILIGDAMLADTPGGDATRMFHAVIQGIGFIGAGAIWKSSEGTAVGLTTAATVFIVAAIGGAVGAGLPVMAGGGTLLVLVALRGLRHMDPGGRGDRNTENED